MGKFSTQTKARSWVVTVQVANMEKAGLTKEEYENPEYLAEVLTNAWNDSGKNRTSGIAVCISEKGLYHAHMALYGNTTTLSNVSKIMFNSHVEPQLGGKKELTDYLTKKGKYAEKDEKVLYIQGLEFIKDSQGSRTDLEQIELYLNEGLTPNQIMEKNFSYRKYEKMIKSDYLLRRIKETPLIKEMNNEWHMGDSGTGKSYYYIKLCEKYSSEDIYMCSDFRDGGLDLYLNDGAPRILFLDEFKGEMRFSNLLTILDKYSRTQTHCRYNNTYNLWTSVIITSIYPPEEIYKQMVSEDNRKTDSYYQLLRRLNTIIYHYVHNGEYKTYSIPANEYTGIKDLLKRVEAVKNGKQITLDDELVDISATQKAKEIFN